ncbi:hypothetical protein BG015_001553 [Linnemannia schmuckeri]|uniref:FAD-binding domain-containing protein n=1 Tax=Linnemannia schmuckeri TaxID=64567 RepID=A0A9P5RSD7_9FUNG|nr:hypothetical protein BG015_001553 [Linnemannia schmuckeri]
MAPNPCIVIVGAGLAGLSLAIMLERAKMHRYVILERGNEYRSLGSAIVLSAMMLRCFEQLGLLEELIAVSKPTTGAVFLDENLKFIGSLPSIFIGQRYGYFNIILTRPEFHRILQGHVPLHKVHFSKKVLEVTQTSERAQIRCSDNTIYHADIVIGADGAYSGIRQSIYRTILTQSRKPNNIGLEKRGLVSTLKKLSSAATSSSSPSLPSSASASASLLSAGASSLSGLGSASVSASSAASVTSFSTLTSAAVTATMMTAVSATKYGGGVNHRGEIRLPKSDQRPLRFDQHAMVGITNSLDPEKYPFLKDKSCQAITILPKSGFSVWLFLVTENRICWGLVAKDFVPSNKEGGQGTGISSGTGSCNSNDHQQQPNFKVSEWGPETVDEIMQLKSVREQKSPYGGIMAEIYDQTPKGTPLRFMIEDKAFKTWYYMRTVLVGDACHKIVPFAGVGAVNAILDCIVLVNCLYDMPDGDAFTYADITAAFQSYYAQRADAAIAAVKGSNKVSAMVGSNNPLSLMICKASIASMPEALISLAADRIFASRPILTFLPFVPDYGERKSNPQPLGRRDREELEVLREKERLEQIEAARLKKEGRKLKKAEFKPGSSLLRIVGIGDGSSVSGGSNSKTGRSSRILMASSAASPYTSTPSVAAISSSASLYTSRHHHLPRPFQQQLPRHNYLDGTAPVGVNSPFSSSSSFLDRSNYDCKHSSSAPNNPPFSPEHGDHANEYYDNGSDTDSMFSFSSRYTLPYDSEVLASQYYTGRRAVYPYLRPSGTHSHLSPSSSPSQASLVLSTAVETSSSKNGKSGAAPLTTEAIASLNRRDSSTSILSTLWKRYGRRNTNNRPLSSVSIQSSTISGVGFRGFTGGACPANGAANADTGAGANDDNNGQAQNLDDDDNNDEMEVEIVSGQNHSAIGVDVYGEIGFDVSPPSSQSSSPVPSGPFSAVSAASQDDVYQPCLSCLTSSSFSSSSSSPSFSPLCTSSISIPSVAAFVRGNVKEEVVDEELYNQMTIMKKKSENETVGVRYEEQMEQAGRAISHYFGDDYRVDFARKATALRMPSPLPPPPPAAAVASSGVSTSTITVTFTSTKPLPSLPKSMMTAITPPLP